MFELPDLPYGYGALGAVISEAALQVHHQKHHARYVEVTNDLLAESGAAYRPLEDVVSLAAKRGARKLFNNAGQAWNHGFFWESMTPERTAPEGELASAIDALPEDIQHYKSLLPFRAALLDWLTGPNAGWSGPQQ